MLTELGNKAGCLCEPAARGDLRCPLMVRSTSEDVLTGELFDKLGSINPRWWIPDLLNRALGAERFRRQVFRKFKIELWQKQPMFPPEHLPFREGQTEVDVVLSWENPPTTIFIEMKYAAPLSANTIHNDGGTGFPADQLIRNARVGLHRSGWYSEDRLFEFSKRDFVLILMSPKRGNPLVTEYRDEKRLRAAIPNGERLYQLPRLPFIGELDYGGVIHVLEDNQRFLSVTERRLASELVDYLRFKMSQWRKSLASGNHQLETLSLLDR